MQNRFNKPRVFLSHARENKQFIRRIADDLRCCQIEPWLDEYEIRDGRPWLKMIFEDGIPTCDAVLVYFTKESLNSKMVERELDAAVVHQLSEGGVRLLPYVSEDSIRDQLRSDLQTLHCREWNNDNYDLVLPTVIAEIWRSYHERTIDAALLQEKNRRLEQELENKRLKEQVESSVFSTSEDQEFKYLRKKLSRQVEITFHLYKNYRDHNLRRKVGTEVCRVSILRMLLAVIHNGQIHFDTVKLGFYLAKAMGETLLANDHEVTRVPSGKAFDSEVVTRILNELQMYGLTKIKAGIRPRSQYEIADKLYRFRYWLEYKDLLKDEPLDHVITLNPEEPQISKQQTDDRVTT
ncbi:MAG TPA: toll/interleukin-1 receptor domain-containing protein [Pyrinomonadaceae bacterium]|nr:toll/interleukin-1 receptor domain-containing protein [Pyrinomonadaceae bacterium]